MKYLIPTLLACIFSAEVFSQEYFVRPNGGYLTQCDGTVNVDYSESITDQKCAVKHIFELLDPMRNFRAISGSDIITIMNNPDGTQAEYEMGMHDRYINEDCNPAYNYDCIMPSPPGGTVESPTIIRGETWDQGCATPPQLWGSGRARILMQVYNAENVKFQCLEITDHHSCISASGFPDQEKVCDRSKPYDKPFADTGIALIDASNVVLEDLTIKGLSTGIRAGRIRDVSLERVNLYANHSAGWNGDINGEDWVEGTVTFKDSAITFSGCGLHYAPGTESHDTPHSCASQQYGGYGDGLGTGKVGGDWIFDNTKIMYNNSDGIDLLYHELGGKVVVKNSRIEGNGGNQLKISGTSEIVNNVIVSNCGWNARQEEDLGKYGERCRALGTAVSVSYSQADDTAKIINNSIVSEGDCLLQSSDRTGVGKHTQGLYVVNNIFYGVTDNHSNWENSCMYYVEPDEEYPTIQVHNNVIHQVKSYANPCENFTFINAIGETANAGLCTSRRSGSFFEDDNYSIPTNPRFEGLNLGIKHSNYDLETLEFEGNNLKIKINTPQAYIGDIAGTTTPEKDYLGNDRLIEGNSIGAFQFYPKPAKPSVISVQLK